MGNFTAAHESSPPIDSANAADAATNSADNTTQSTVSSSETKKHNSRLGRRKKKKKSVAQQSDPVTAYLGEWGASASSATAPGAAGLPVGDMMSVARPVFTPQAFIDMRGITKTFNVGQPSELTVVKGVNFAVNKGEFVAVLGASGSGKSTLMNIIGLLDRPTAGGYFFDDVDMLAIGENDLAAARSRKIGFVFQTFNLIGRISSLSNVEMPMMYAGVPRKQRQQRAAELLDSVGMSDRMEHSPNELSGGQKQRVAIARALANDPGLILADEPTGALDSKTGRVVMDLFHKLNEQGKTIIFITHNPELADECNRSVVMMDGELTAADGTPLMPPVCQPKPASTTDTPGGAS